MDHEKLQKYLTEDPKKFWYSLIPGGVFILIGILLNEVRALRVLRQLGNPMLFIGGVYILVMWLIKLKGKDALEFTGDQMTAQTKEYEQKVEDEIEAYHKEVFKKEHRESGPFEKLFAAQYLAGDDILTRRVSDVAYVSERGEVCALWKERKGKILRVCKSAFRFTTEEKSTEEYLVGFSQISDLNWEEYHCTKGGIKCKQLHVSMKLADQPVTLVFPADYDSENYFSILKEEIANEK
ncbi:MAG: hypothetical protein MJ070_05770 [Lachnospiraceae bacterium]|nr:hypothetical protein [Lachnospiraceae bacterium]